MIPKARRPGTWKSSGLLATVGVLVLAGYAATVASDNPVRAKTPEKVVQSQAALPAPVSFSSVIERVSPAVVSIQVTQKAPAVAQMRGRSPASRDPDGMEEFLRRFFGEDRLRQFGQPNQGEAPGTRRSPAQRQVGSGSGFIVDPKGYIVTNDHVVRGAAEIIVKMKGGKKYEATLVGRDSLTDLALLKVDAGKDLPHVSFSKNPTPKVGDWVVTIGNPFGLGHTVTAGIVSAHHRSIGQGPYDDFIQIDAPINRGNSGGPAFSTNGDVIGVNTAIFSPTGGSVGIGFAIPASTARDVIAKLKDGGSVERGWLGVQIQAVTEDVAASLGLEEAKGALVSKVTADSPADQAGVLRGDLIVGVNGEDVSSVRVLPRLVAAIAPGRAAQLTLLRKGEERKVTVKVGLRPGPRQVAEAEQTKKLLLGMRLQTLDPATRDRFNITDDVSGVVITTVHPSSSAAAKGLSVGDVIVEVANEPVISPKDVVAKVQAAGRSSRKAVLFLIRKEAEQRFVALPLRKA
jgi:serine protease Do